jgi:hypothetical protein
MDDEKTKWRDPKGSEMRKGRRQKLERFLGGGYRSIDE